jgi:hypothetical protein
VAERFPFEPKRLFLVDQVTPGLARGAHSHRACHQLLIAVSGAMKAVIDDGKNAWVVPMTKPHLGLYIPPMVWSMQFGHTVGAALLVIASDTYDNKDYITKYSEFIQLAQQTVTEEC